MTTKLKLNQIYPVPAQASNSELTGTPTAPTPSTSDDSNKISTTAYVKDNLENYSTSSEIENNYLALSGGDLTGNFYGKPFVDPDDENIMFICKDPLIAKGTLPDTNHWFTLGIATDNTGSPTNDHKFGQVETAVYTTGKVEISLGVFKNIEGDTIQQRIGIGYDASNNLYTLAPTPATTDNSTKIATTAFVKAQGCNVDSSSIGTNGYIRFTNGLQLQWGQVNQSNSSSDAGTSVTFTKAFSSEPRIFVDTSWGGKYKMTLGLQVFNRSATGFSVISPSYNGTNLVYDTGGISWFAIGPWS